MEEMYTQMENILKAYSEDIIKPRPTGPVIFMIAAASGAGKRTLMEAMYSMGRRTIKVIQKATNRNAQPGDGEEIIPNQLIDDGYAIKYNFNGKMYGIKTDSIWENLAAGHPQIIVTNMDEFHQFSKIFGRAAIGVYLHATRTQEEILDFQTKKLNNEVEARKKVEKIEIIHQGYIREIAKFKHVLLNTIEKEDLWDQMFRLIKYYQSKSN
jgi:guanylate kinase